jgi:hypothetical protein
MVEQICHSIADQITIAIPLGKQPASSDQVITELPPYPGPRSPLDLVGVEFVFGRLFEAFRGTSQATRTGTSAGADTRPAKKSQVPSMKKILVAMYAMILICTLMFVNSICILMMHLSIGNL